LLSPVGAVFELEFLFENASLVMLERLSSLGCRVALGARRLKDAKRRCAVRKRGRAAPSGRSFQQASRARGLFLILDTPGPKRGDLGKRRMDGWVRADPV